jgi:adenine-specific DNA-methyltransferase
MRRFSAKEEERRIVAAPLLAGEFPGQKIGLENHLNYIHRPKGAMRPVEAVGLAAVFNSAIVDRYFRISNGNTQVSAVELNCLPLPSREDIIAIGKRVEKVGDERAVAEVLGIPETLQEQLSGCAG